MHVDTVATTRLQRRAPANAAAASYRLRRVLDNGGSQSLEARGGGRVCDGRNPSCR